MKKANQSSRLSMLAWMIMCSILIACNNPQQNTANDATVDSVAANIKMYTHV